MKIKKILAVAIISGMLNMTFPPITCHAVEKRLTKKQKMELQAEQTRLAYVNLNWWNDYNDVYLNEYIKKALDNNQDLKIATLRVEEARQATKVQFASELPSLSVGASPALYKMTGVSNTEGLFSVPVIASYELDLFLKNHDKTKSVKKVYEASKFQEKSAYISVISAVGTCYYNIVKLDKLISIQDEIISDREKIYDLMKQSNEVGLISTSDLVKADKARVVASCDSIELKKAREIMLNSLAVLIGESPNNISSLKRISYDKLEYIKPIPNEISSEIITNRPDYQVAEKMVEKAGIDVRVAKKEFLPSINLIGLMSFASGSAMPSMSWNSSLAALAASAMLPVFTGGRRLAVLRMKKNKYEQVLQEYYKTNLTAMKEVNDALSTLKLDNEKYNKNLKTLSMEQRDFKYTQAKFHEGVISNLDLLQQKENLLVVKKLVTSSKVDCFVNQIGLYKATAAENL